MIRLSLLCSQLVAVALLVASCGTGRTGALEPAPGPSLATPGATGSDADSAVDSAAADESAAEAAASDAEPPEDVASDSGEAAAEGGAAIAIETSDPPAKSPEEPETVAAGDGSAVITPTESEAGEAVAIEEAGGASVGDKPAAGSVPFTLVLEPLGGGPVRRIPIELRDAGRAAALDRSVSVAGEMLTLVRYEPTVKIEDRLAPAPEGRPGFSALRLNVEARGENLDKWAVPGSRLLGRAYFRDAIFECLPEESPAEARETEAFLTELYQPTPKILVELKESGKRFFFPATVGQRFERADLGLAVEVVRVVNCFMLDGDSQAVDDQSTKPLNPAARVRITSGGETRTTWLFSRLPEFAPHADDDVARLRFVWPVKDHPHPRAEVVFFDAAEGPFTVVLSSEGGVRTHRLDRTGAINVPGMRFRIAERLDEAVLLQKAAPAPGGRPAVQVRAPAGSGEAVYWVSNDTPRPIALGPASAFTAHLRAGVSSAHGTAAGMNPHRPQVRPGRMPAGHPVLPKGHPRLPAAPEGMPHPLPKERGKQP